MSFPRKGILFVLSLILSFSVIQLIAQENYPPEGVNCGSFEANEAFFDNHPEQKSIWTDFSKELPPPPNSDNCETHYVIPVVFHVFNSSGASYITQAQIQSALDKANEDFNGLNGDFNTVDPAFQGIRGTVNITFVLAGLDPNGNPTTGINYYPTLSGFGNGSGYNTQISSYAWDNYKYMNVYIMRDLYNDGVTNNSGVAWYPNSWMSDNGLARIVYNDLYLGDTGSSVADGEFQSVFTHEIGHWLNLAHTFDTGCSGTGDGVTDTPTTTGAAGCGPNAFSCGHITNGENYMDYNATCYKMFTEGQIARMVNALENHPTRQPLWQLSNLVATGTSQHYQYLNPIADFTASEIFINEGETVFFNDESCGFPTNWSWTINGGNPSSSSNQNPSSVFNTAGEYDVTLIVSNSSGTSTPFTITIYVDTDPLSCNESHIFEGESTGSLASGWGANNSGSNINWIVAEDVYHGYAEVSPFTSNGHNSIKSLYCPENWAGSGPTQITLVSPLIDLTGMIEPKLSYWTLRGWDSAWPTSKPVHTIELLGGNTPNGPWTALGTDAVSETDFHNWNEVADIDLTAFAGGTMYIAFRTNTHHYYWRIDDMCISESALLPIDMTAFTGHQENNDIVLNWNTVRESNNKGFEVQRLDLSNNKWENLGFVEGAGNSLQETNYRFIDSAPNSGLNYYRLKQINFNSTFEFSEVIHIEFKDESEEITLHPNPFSNSITFSNVKEPLEIELYNTNGNLILKKTTDHSGSMNLSEIPSGIYFISFIQNGNIFHHKIIKE